MTMTWTRFAPVGLFQGDDADEVYTWVSAIRARALMAVS
jgi:hypothetical protein